MNEGAPPVHRSVLLQEALAALQVKAEGRYVDATFGRGGHSAEILRRLGESGRLLAIDRDPAAIAAGAGMVDGRMTLLHAAFGAMDEVLDGLGWNEVDGVLLDLGVSSPQLDEAERGFSFRHDAPLDMRMDTSRGETAAQWLERASQQEIRRVIKDYGEERFADAIAKAVVAARGEHRISGTRQFAALVEKAVRTREPGKHPATRSFQALRIHINQELEELSLALPTCAQRLAPGGRLVVISFHSLEDRLVKRFLRSRAQPPELPARLPLRAAEMSSPTLRLVGKVVFPGEAEIAANPRARSAVMRVAEKR